MDWGKVCRLEHEGKEAVENVLDEILTKGAQNLYIKYVLGKQPEFLGELYAKAWGCLADGFTLPPDKGDDKAALRRYWQEDKEPVSHV